MGRLYIPMRMIVRRFCFRLLLFPLRALLSPYRCLTNGLLHRPLGGLPLFQYDFLCSHLFFAVVFRTTFFTVRLTGFLFFTATFFTTFFFFVTAFFLAGMETSDAAFVVDAEELHCLIREGV